MRYTGIVIDYLSEPVKDYITAIDSAATLNGLLGALETFKLIANDTFEFVLTWTESDFDDWRLALKAERAGEFCGKEAAERFGVVFMPLILLVVSMVAKQYQAPWGTAYIRMRDEGIIKESARDGIATYQPNKAKTT